MVLSVPTGQVPEEVLYRIECGYLLGVDQFHDLGLRTPLLHDSLTLGPDHDAVEGRLRERPVNRLFGRQCCKLHLPAQHIAAEEVIVL